MLFSSAMSERVTIRLPADLSQALEAASARLRCRRSDVVRLALYQFLGLVSEDDGMPSARVQHLIGSLETGIPELAENHRAYILEAL